MKRRWVGEMEMESQWRNREEYMGDGKGIKGRGRKTG